MASDMQEKQDNPIKQTIQKTLQYTIIVYDDVYNRILVQDVLTTYDRAELHAEKLKMFFGFGTTISVEVA